MGFSNTDLNILLDTNIDVNPNVGYQAERLKLIIGNEGHENTIYIDTAGIPTIGYGFNLLEEINLKYIFKAVNGVDPSPIQLNALKLAVSENRTNLIDMRSDFSTALGASQINTTTSLKVFNNIINSFEATVTRLLGTSNISNSWERLALVDMAYRGGLKNKQIDSMIIDAAKAGDRPGLYLSILASIQINDDKLSREVAYGEFLRTYEVANIIKPFQNTNAPTNAELRNWYKAVLENDVYIRAMERKWGTRFNAEAGLERYANFFPPLSKEVVLQFLLEAYETNSERINDSKVRFNEIAYNENGQQKTMFVGGNLRSSLSDEINGNFDFSENPLEAIDAHGNVIQYLSSTASVVINGVSQSITSVVNFINNRLVATTNFISHTVINASDNYATPNGNGYANIVAGVVTRMINGMDFEDAVTDVTTLVLATSIIKETLKSFISDTDIIAYKKANAQKTAGLTDAQVEAAMLNETVAALIISFFVQAVVNGFEDVDQVAQDVGVQAAVQGGVKNVLGISGAAGAGIASALSVFAFTSLNGQPITQQTVGQALIAGTTTFAAAAIVASVSAPGASMAWIANITYLGIDPVTMVAAALFAYAATKLLSGSKTYHDETISHTIEVQPDGSLKLIGLRETGALLRTTGTTDDDYIGTDSADDSVGADVIVGQAGKNEIYAKGGHDFIEGRANDDYIEAGTGNDHVEAGSGNDYVDGGGGNDRLYGQSGNDQILGGTGDDIILGGDGDDRIEGNDGNDRIYGGAGADTVAGGAGNDRIEGGAGADVLNGEAGNDELSGGAGDDILHGNDGNDILAGGDGNDDVRGDGGDDIIFGESGVDQLYGGDGNDLLNGGNENDIAFGGLGNDALVGELGDDDLYGEIGNDLLAGGRGKDLLDGGDGNDIFLYRKGDGLDTIQDSDGVNALKLYDLQATDMQSIARVGDNLVLTFDAANIVTIKDQFTTTGLNAIEFADGRKINVASMTYDSNGLATYSLVAGTDVLASVALPFALYQQSTGDFQASTALTTGWHAANYDTTVLTDAYQLELYNDVQVKSWKKKSGFMGMKMSVGYYDYFEKFLLGSGYADRIVGMYWDETINAGNSNDQAYGNGGNDTISGGADHDILFGGAGLDVMNGDAGHDKIFGGTGNDTLNGGTGNDTLDGEEGDDIIDGQQDDDVIFGGVGNDTLSGGDGRDIVFGDEGNDTLNGGTNDDYLNGGIGNDTLNGGDGSDLMYGGDGDDILNGNEGDDIIIASSGNDNIDGGNGVDTLFLAGRVKDYQVAFLADGRVKVTDIRPLQMDGISTLTNVEKIQFSDKMLELTKLFPSTLVLRIVSGSSVLSKIGLPDGYTLQINQPPTFGTMGVQSGNILSYNAPASANNGSFGYTLTTLDGISKSFQGTVVVQAGPNLSGTTTTGEIIVGSSAINSLLGTAGDDILINSAGNDTFNGGSGVDKAIFAGAFADYVVTINATDVVQIVRSATSETEQLTNIELLSFSDRTIDLRNRFPSLPAVITAQSAFYQGSIPLSTGMTASVVSVPSQLTFSFGAGGAFNLTSSATGGSYEIQYKLVDAEGISKSYKLPVSVSATAGVITMSSGAATNNIIVGSSLADQLLGGDGADILYGGSGNDMLDGGTGDDILNGGAGNDTLNGGSGFDETRFSGLLGDYTIDMANGSVTIKDIRATSIDGIDVLQNIERISFSDQSISLIDLFPAIGQLVIPQGQTMYYSLPVGVTAEVISVSGAGTAGTLPGGGTLTYHASSSSVDPDTVQIRLTHLLSGATMVQTVQVLPYVGTTIGYQYQGQQVVSDANWSYQSWQDNLAMTKLNDGGLVVVHNSGMAGTRVAVYRYNSDMEAIGSPIYLPDLAQYEQIVNVVALNDGGFAVLWTRSPAASAYDVVLQRFDAQGNTAGSLVQVNGDSTWQDYKLSATVLTDGQMIVVYNKQVTGNGQSWIYTKHYSATGVALTSDILVSDGYNKPLNPTVTLMGSGYLIVFVDNYGSIYGQKMTSAGTKNSTSFLITSATAGSVYPVATTLANGNVLVAWAAYNGSVSDIYARRYDANGNAIGNEFLVNDITTGNQIAPRVLALSDGGFLVYWESYNDGISTATDLWSRRFDSNGNSVAAAFVNYQGESMGSVVRIHPEDITGNQTGAAAIELENGDIVFSWQSFPSSNNSQTYIARYEALHETSHTVTGDSSNNVLIGGQFDDIITGANGNDVLQGGEGDDSLSGEAGDDIYMFQRGNGTDYINNADSVGYDKAMFGVDTHMHQLWFRQSGYTLIVEVLGTSDKIIFENWYIADSQKIDLFELADGHILTKEAVEGLVESMGGYNAASFAQINSLSDLPQNVQTAITVAWSSRFSGVQIAGTSSDDVLTGNNGDDVLTGGAGNDILDGKAGSDTAAFLGNRSDYALTFKANGLEVKDLRSGSPDGTDLLKNIEGVSFQDAYIYANSLLPKFGNARVPQGESMRLMIPEGMTVTVIGSVNSGTASVSPDGRIFTYTAPTNSLLPANLTLRITHTASGASAVQQVAVNIVQELAPGEYKVGNLQTVSGALSSVSAWGENINMGMTRLQDGGVVIVHNSGANTNIVAYRYDSSLSPVGSVINLPDLAAYEQWPEVVALNDGGFMVLWSRSPAASAYDVVFQRYNASGQAQGSTVQVNSDTTNQDTLFSAKVLSNGQVVVAYQKRISNNGNAWIYARHFNPDGTAATSDVLVSPTAFTTSLAPVVTQMGAGYIVAWVDGSTGMYAQKMNANGTKNGDYFKITSSITAGIDPALTTLTDGSIFAVWSAPNGAAKGIYGRRYSATGVVYGDAFLLQSYTQGIQPTPHITALRDGGFFIYWTTSGDGTSTGIDIWGKRFDKNGQIVNAGFVDAQNNSLGSVFRLHTEITGTQNSPLVTELENGDLVVAWQSFPSSGSPSTYMARYQFLGQSGYTLNGGADSDLLVGGALNDTLTGGDGADTLQGGAGNDLLKGGSGNDTYSFDGNFGKDTVQNLDSAGHDRALFGPDIQNYHLWFSQNGSDLMVQNLNGTSQIKFEGWYASADAKIDEFKLYDGKSLDSSKVDQLVSAMAAFNPQSVGTVTGLSSLPNSVQAVIAASWTT